MNDKEKKKDDEIVWMCDECPKYHESESEFQKHKNKCHDKTEELCPHCGRVIVGKRNLTYHIRSSHEMAKCNKCNKEMKKKNIPRHMLRCQSDNVSMLSCSECDTEQHTRSSRLIVQLLYRRWT